MCMNLCWRHVAATQFALYMALANLGYSAGSALAGLLDTVFEYSPIFFIMAAGSGTVLVLLLGRRALGRAWSIVRRVAPLLIVCALVVGWAPAAQAGSEPSMQLQIRLGPYYPAIDSEESLQVEPFKDIFGSSTELLFNEANS